MAQVTIDIGGHHYKLACRDGEEARLEKLAGYLNDKVVELTQVLGQVSESRMLLMAALMLADELFEAREAGGVAVDGSAAAPVAAGDEQGEALALLAETTAFLDEAAGRAEALAAALDRRT